MKDNVFVTGMPRSGTTLLDKLLSMHRKVLVLSQPLPLLYVELKKRYLKEKVDHCDNVVYPINDMYGDNYYSVEHFSEYLTNYRMDQEILLSVIDKMKDYDGQYTKVTDATNKLELKENSYSLIESVNYYLDLFKKEAELQVFGSKETFCEEFIPYYINNNIKVILIIRDPRDVYTSLNFGKGRQYGGLKKPILYTIRQWRKSIYYALKYRNYDNMLLVRYEDLVKQTVDVAKRITDFLGVSRIDEAILVNGIKTKDGDRWESNSSHIQSNKIYENSIGKYKNYLSKDEKELIEACAYYEMTTMAYDVDIHKDEIANILQSSSIKETLEREELKGYLWNKKLAQQELERLDNITRGVFDKIKFIFLEAFNSLLELHH